MTFDPHKPRTLPFDKDCITDEDVRGLEIPIPSCEIAEVPAPGRIIPAGRPTMPIMTPPPPLCLQPCPAPFSYDVIAPLQIRMRMDCFLDPATYAMLSTASSEHVVITDTSATPYNVPYVVITARPNAVMFIFLVYNNETGKLVPQPHGGYNSTSGNTNLGMFHLGSSLPTYCPAPEYGLLLLHRIDTRGAHAYDQVLKCPPGVSNPPRSIALPATSAVEPKHPFKLFKTAAGCGVAIWPGTVLDSDGITHNPTLNGLELSLEAPYTSANLTTGSVSFWLRVRYVVSGETERVGSVVILTEGYAANLASNDTDLYVLIGRVLYGGVNESTGRCILTPWNNLKASIAISKCDARHTVMALDSATA